MLCPHKTEERCALAESIVLEACRRQVEVPVLPQQCDACTNCRRYKPDQAPQSLNFMVASLIYKAAGDCGRELAIPYLRRIAPLAVGPGRQLHDLLKSVSIDVKLGCSCRALMAQMNQLGVDGCRRERSSLLASLKQNARKYTWVEILGALRKTITSGLITQIDMLDPLSWLLDEALRREELRLARRSESEARRWAVAVTTAPRRQPTLERTLKSLQDAGWPDVHVFSEPGVPRIAWEGIRWRQNKKALQGCPNFLHAARTLLAENPNADFYLLVQDDVIFSRRARAYLEAEAAAGALPDAAVLSLYCSSTYDKGQWEWAPGGRIGALTYLFRRDDLRSFLGSSHAKRSTNSRIDVMVGGWSLTQPGREIRFHVPSLAQHIGDTSTIWRRAANAGLRRARSFLGEEFDAMTLVGIHRPPAEGRTAPRIGLVGWNAPTGLGTLNREIARQLPITHWLTFQHPRFPDDEETIPGVEIRRGRKTVGDVIKLLREVDAVIFCETPYLDQLPQIARSLRVRTICVAMAEWMPKGGRGWPRQTNVVICPTEDCYRQFGHVFKTEDNRAVYIPWPVDVSALPFRPREKAERFLYVQGGGGVRDRKGGEIVKAAARLAPEVPLIVYSQRPDAWPAHVELRGSVPSIADLYRDGDVAVQPSRFEGLGLNLIEPQACGLPLVTTDGAPMREHNPLRLIPASSRTIIVRRPTTCYDASAEALAEILRELHGRDIVAESRAAREWVERERSWEARREEILAQVLGGVKPSKPRKRGAFCWDRVLPLLGPGKVVVEIGASRDPRPIAREADGHSTARFAATGAIVHAVDVDERALRVTRELAPTATLHRADGLEFLKIYDGPPIDLLYLDGPHPDDRGQRFALECFRAGLRVLSPAGVVLVDDCDLADGGKGRLIEHEAEALGFRVAFQDRHMLLVRSEPGQRKAA